MAKQRLIDVGENSICDGCNWEPCEGSPSENNRCYAKRWIDEQPTVEPDDFVSVMREFNRMCASKNLCNGCPLLLSSKYEFGTKLAHCSADHMAFENPEEFVEIVKKWSNEHPEMPCDAYNSGVCMSNGDRECSCGGDSGICEIMTKRGGIDSVC